MRQLEASQKAFMAALFSDAQAEPFTCLILPAGVSETRRLDVYRNNVYSNLRGALQAVYPVVERLVGAPFFKHAADLFIAAHPSLSGDIHDFGQEFAHFLSDYPHAASLAYLPDVARLEWLYHRVFHAAEHEPLDLSRLSTIAPAVYPRLRFALHPASALLDSAFPVLRIWQVNQDDYQGEMQVDLAGAPVQLVLSRRDQIVTIEEVAPPVFALLAGFARGAALESTVDAALALDPEFDLQRTLAQLIQGGILADFSAD